MLVLKLKHNWNINKLFKGSIDTTVFKSEKEIKEGDIVILINFNRDKYRGGDVFRAGDETKILLNDDTYQFTIDNANFECTEYLKMWYVVP